VASCAKAVRHARSKKGRKPQVASKAHLYVFKNHLQGEKRSRKKKRSREALVARKKENEMKKISVSLRERRGRASCPKRNGGEKTACSQKRDRNKWRKKKKKDIAERRWGGKKNSHKQ